MRISSIYNINFTGIEKRPTNKGYKLYEDEVLKKEMEYDFDTSRLTYKFYDEKGEKQIAEKRYYPNYNQKDTFEYDKNGSLIKKISYNQMGEIISENKYLYYENGKLKDTLFDYGDSNLKIETKYDEDEKKTVSVMQFGNEKSVSKFTYDNKGNLLKEIMYNEDSEKIGETDYKYSENGTLIKMIAYDENGEITKQEEYDSNTGKAIKNYTCELDEKKYETYNYDNEGRLIEETIKEGGNPLIITRYIYNNLGKLKRRVTISQDELIKKEEFDSCGNVILEAHYTRGSQLIYKKENCFDEHKRQIGYVIKNNLNKPKYMKYIDYETDRIIETGNELNAMI